MRVSLRVRRIAVLMAALCLSEAGIASPASAASNPVAPSLPGRSVQGATRGNGSTDSGALDAPPSTTFTTPASGTTVQSATAIDVTWTESDGGGGGISSRSLQRQVADVVTPGTCSGVTWANDGSADTNVSPRTVGGLATDYLDNFGRSVATNSWGTADAGGSYTLSGTTNGTFSVNGSIASLALNASSYRSAAALLSTSMTSSDIRAKFSLDKVPTGGAVTVVFGTRAVTNSNGGYYAQAVFQTSGSIYGNFVRLANSNGAQTAITTATNTGLAAYTANRWLNLRFSATGTSPTSLGLKVWYDGTAEPGSWTFSTTDSNADQQQPGSPVAGASTASGVSNLPVTVAYDYISMSDGSDPARCYRWQETLTNGSSDVTTTTSGSVLVDSSVLSAAFVQPPAGTTSQSSPVAEVSWSEGDGGSGIASRSLQRQIASIVTAGTCAGVTWTNDGSADTGTSPRTVAGLTTDYRDNFARTVSPNSWGSSEVGGSYTLTGTGSGTFSSDGSFGNLVLAASNYRAAAALLSSSITTTDLRTKFRLDKVPTGGAVSVLAGTRVVSATKGGYYAQVNFTTTGSIYGNFVRLSNSTGTQTAITTSTNTGMEPYVAGSWVNLRLSAAGTSPTALAMKVWYDGSPEPSSWTFATTDSNADQQQAGSLALGSSTASGVSNLNITAQFDYLSVSDGTDTAKCYRWTQTITNGAGATANATSGSILIDDAAPAVVYPSGGGETSSRTLTWSVPNAQNAYQAQIATDTAFTVNLTDSGTVTSSTPAYLAPSLTGGTAYYWRVRVKETSGGSLGAWSTTASFVYRQGATLGVPGQDSFESFGLGNSDSASINVSTDNFVVSHPLVALPIVGGSLSLAITYNSQSTANAGTGPGWRLDSMRRLTELGNGDVVLVAGDGSAHTFTKISTVGTVTTYTRPSTVYATMRKDTAQTLDWTLTYRDQSVDSFDQSGSEGVLAKQADRFGNAVIFSYTSGTNRLSQATDPNGRVVDFAWDTGASPARLTSITDWAYVSSGVIQSTTTGSRRQYRFFYDASGYLIGWSSPLNTSGSCPTQQSNLTCLTYNAAGMVTTITKRMTQAYLNAGAIDSQVRDLVTTVSYVGNEVAQFQDAQQTYDGNAGTTFQRVADKQMQVKRPGSVTTTTTYGFIASTDSLGRVESTWRKLDAAQIEERTTWDAAFPTERASITDNYGAQLSTPARTISFTYVAGSMGLVARMVEPLTSTKKRYADYTYNANNDSTQETVYQKGASAQTITRYCYAATGCSTSGTSLTLRALIENYKDGSKGGSNGNEDDVTTEYLYDAFGQRTRGTRYNYDSTGTLLDSRAVGYSYDSNGNQVAVVVNYADGDVLQGSGDPYDASPDPSTGARTDLTTVLTYDTAGNQVSSADPCRAIALGQSQTLNADDYVARTEFDALNHATRKAVRRDPSDGVAPEASLSVYDELGNLRQTTDLGGLVSASQYDRAGRVTLTLEDVDGAGGTNAIETNSATYDRAGRLLTAKSRNQFVDSSLGITSSSYDELGRQVTVTEGSGSSPNIATTTTYTYDALDRLTSQTKGGVQTTITTYDLAGRSTAVDDEFTCTTKTYDYRDLQQTETTGLDSGCQSGGDQRTVANSWDGMSRLMRTEVTAPSTDATYGDRTYDVTFDSAGRQLTSAVRTNGTTSMTTFTLSWLDVIVAETRADGSTTKTNHDAVGNSTDRCYWGASITVGSCYEVGHSGWTNPPTQVTTATFDARANRVAFRDSSSNAISVYDPNNNYQVEAIYLATGSGKEHQTLYSYDERHRLIGITQQLCTISSGHSCSSTIVTGSDSYTFDENTNRTLVDEDNGDASATQHYCYDALNRLRYRNTGAACSSGANNESYTYDAAGNRTQTVVAGTTTDFAYNTSGQLCKVGASSCTSPNVTYDTAGRFTSYNGWVYAYDARGRLTSACKSTSCSGSIDKIEFSYDGEGNRTQIKEYIAGTLTATRDFSYQGDAVVQEKTNGTVSREYVDDEQGTIIKFCDPNCTSPTTTYLVVWNGHGDALGAWKIDPLTGALTLVNGYTYTSWGTPTTTVTPGFSDLGFAFEYLGADGVQWDNFSGLGLLYMRARHYSPSIGRFLQADPVRVDANDYAYAANNPITNADPSGLATRTVSITSAVYDGVGIRLTYLRTVVTWTYQGGLVTGGNIYSYVDSHKENWGTTPRPAGTSCCGWQLGAHSISTKNLGAGAYVIDQATFNYTGGIFADAGQFRNTHTNVIQVYGDGRSSCASSVRLLNRFFNTFVVKQPQYCDGIMG